MNAQDIVKLVRKLRHNPQAPEILQSLLSNEKNGMEQSDLEWAMEGWKTFRRGQGWPRTQPGNRPTLIYRHRSPIWLDPNND